MDKIKFEIKQELGILSEAKSGWRRELNLVSWNGAPPKYDIRDWGPGHEKIGKGVAMDDEEMKKLKQILDKIDQG